MQVGVLDDLLDRLAGEVRFIQAESLGGNVVDQDEIFFIVQHDHAVFDAGNDGLQALLLGLRDLGPLLEAKRSFASPRGGSNRQGYGRAPGCA